jgi:serine/threonine-protein kinase HipA
VKLQIFYQKRLLGALADDPKSRKIYFQYDDDFLSQKIDLSPLKLPFVPRPQFCGMRDFQGLFGLFYDSLPDRWGMTLLERKLHNDGVQAISALTHLAYMGDRSMGALSYVPDLDGHSREVEAIHLLKTNREARTIYLKGILRDVSPELLQAGASPGGARPKVLLGIDAERKKFISGSGDLPEGYEHWLVKLDDGSKDPHALWEALYLSMAKACGIRVPEYFLIPTGKNKMILALKRFDRIHNRRIHYHSFSGITHTTFMESADYDTLLGVTRNLTHDQREVEQAFRRAVFNLMGCVRDDHVKNHGFLFDGQKWGLSPAFDLIPSKWNGAHSLSYGGESLKPTLKHLENLGVYHSIGRSKVMEQIQKTREVFDSIDHHAREVGLNGAPLEGLKKHLKNHWKRVL